MQLQPLRKHVKNKLDEDAYYGFFSPKFYMKTGLDANDIKQFISIQEETTQKVRDKIQMIRNILKMFTELFGMSQRKNGIV